MQDTTDFAPISANDTAQSRNLAAIALAEAIHRARQQQGMHAAPAHVVPASTLSKLHGLRRKLAPLYAAIPQDVALFDLGFVTEEKPRLFIDIIAFVEMSIDSGQYRFVQETRSGHSVLLETDDETTLIARITDYIARRLIDREKAIEADAKVAAVVSDKPLPVAAPPQPRPGPSMTAAEAFRQWSAAGKTLGEKSSADKTLPPAAAVSGSAPPATPAPAVDFSSATVVPQDDHRPAATTVSAKTDTMRTDATKTAIESAASSISEAAQAIRLREASAVMPAATAIPTAKPMAAAPVPRSNAWWLWPLIALLLGIGLGIAALYAYAASLTR
jgi:hypothetical protein